MCHVQVLRYHARKYNFTIRCTRTQWRSETLSCKSNRFPFAPGIRISCFQRNRRVPRMIRDNVYNFLLIRQLITVDNFYDLETRLESTCKKILSLARRYKLHPTFLVVATWTPDVVPGGEPSANFPSIFIIITLIEK